MILLLNILKVVAGILIFLLLLILLLLSLVLFVPLRYRAEGQYGTERTSFRGRITYLLHFISLQISYETSLQIKLKLLGIPVFDSGRKKKVPKAAKEKKKEKRETREEAPPKREESPTEKEASTQWEPLQEAKEEVPPKAKEIPPNTKKTKVQKNPSSKKEKTSENVLETIGRYLELWHREETQAAFALGKKTLFKVLKVILPRKWLLQAKIGFEDPALTGYLMAALGILYPVFGNHIVIIPDFENEILEVEGRAKGHITFAVILAQIIRIVLNQHCRKFFKLFRSTVSGEKQEETNGR